jgi:gas vesicle protein
MPETVAGWIRTNLGAAAALVALAGTVVGGIVAATAWLTSVHHLETRVDVLRTDVNTMRATMESNRTVVNDIRRQLDGTDATLKEGLGRVDERLKAVERRP